MTLLAADFTLLHLIPPYSSFEQWCAGFLQGTFGPSFVEGADIKGITHISMSVVAVLVVLAVTFITKSAWSGAKDSAIPAGKFSIANFAETLMDAVLGLSEQVLGSREEAERFMPLIAALAFYIFFNNILGLVPGFFPATDNLNVTFGPAIVVFLVSHYVGVKAQGIGHYLGHFLGPPIVGKLPLLAPLMVPIELISHLARPVSLSLRLMGNMTGDHKVLAIFLGLAAVPLIFPIPVLILGTVVCTVQTLVFCLLSLVYIALAIEHSDEAH